MQLLTFVFMKHLVFILLFLTAASCSGNFQSFSWTYNDMITIEIFVLDTPPPGTTPGNAVDRHQGFIRGKQCYDNYTGRTVVGVVAALFPPAGLLAAIVVSLTPPNPYGTFCVDDNSLLNLSYLDGFKMGLHREKANMVWGGFLNGWAAGIAIAFLIIAIAGVS